MWDVVGRGYRLWWGGGNVVRIVGDGWMWWFSLDRCFLVVVVFRVRKEDFVGIERGWCIGWRLG